VDADVGPGGAWARGSNKFEIFQFQFKHAQT
jgi:hypothetical protein